MPVVAHFPAPAIALGDFDRSLSSRGYAVLSAGDVGALAGVSASDLAAITPSWDALELDDYLKDGGRYRRRRHSCFVVDGEGGSAALRQVPHRMHWQPVEYNALHGGMERWFAPIAEGVIAQAPLPALITALAAACSRQTAARRWHVEAHQFRIDTSDGLGRPTPEGAHRDGVDFVAVLLVARHGIKGGETRVFDAQGPDGQRFTLEEPWSMLFMADARVIHESTPIQPTGDALGYRDTLVLTFRAAGFLGEPAGDRDWVREAAGAS